ncbi:MAG: site-2 protease family protein [Fusobacteriaceae bacterium]|nr:site-2 protease family protein [Fusobacteriaceae bacterium]
MSYLENILYSLPGLVAGFTIHEFFHAFMAYCLGDNTAKEQGRLTLNPLKHLDKLGFLLLVLTGFGWAKPVFFDEDSLKHPRRDKALIALAGPVSNFALAVLILTGVRFLDTAGGARFLLAHFSRVAIQRIFLFLITFAAVNIGIGAFNLIPIPPLDGSRIFLSGFDVDRETEQKFLRTGGIMLIGLLMLERLAGIRILRVEWVVGGLIRLILR